MKLTRDDTVGVRPSASVGGGGPSSTPTPEEFVDALSAAMQRLFGSMTPEQLASAGARLSATTRAPPPARARALLEAFAAKLDVASDTAVVQLLAALPGLAASEPAAAVPEGWVRACLDKVGSGMGSMQLNDMAGGRAALAAGSHSPGAAFLGARAAQAQARLDEAAPPPLTACARLACALAAVDAAPSAAWLASLQRATLPALTRAAAQSRPPPASAVAELAWATAQLARNSTASSGAAGGRAPGASLSVDRSLMVPEWLSALTWCVNSRGVSPNGDPLRLQDLSRAVWALAAFGVEPKKDVVNSFVGKSQDRLSSLRYS